MIRRPSSGRHSSCFPIGRTSRSPWMAPACRWSSGRVLEHRRMLDLRQGVLWREWRQQNSSGRITRVRFLRLASLADRHALLQSVAVTVENYSGRIELVAGLTLPDGRGERRPLTVTRDLATVMVVAPETSIAMAAGSVVQPKSEATKSRQQHPTDHVEERWSWEAGLGETVCLDRVVAVYTSRDVADPGGHGESSCRDDPGARGAGPRQGPCRRLEPSVGRRRGAASSAMTRPSGRSASPCITW